MGFIKGIFTFIGLLVVGALIFAFVKFDLMGKVGNVAKLDPKAMGAYMTMFGTVLETGNAADAMIRKVKINPDVSNEDVVESMKSIATDANMLQVGDSKMQIKTSINDEGGKRYIRILHYCSPGIAEKFIDYSEAFGAFMPCRVLIVEDDNGDRWLYTMAMELLLFGGQSLPPEMLELAEHVRDTMYRMQDMGAEGDF